MPLIRGETDANEKAFDHRSNGTTAQVDSRR